MVLTIIKFTNSLNSTRNNSRGCTINMGHGNVINDCTTYAIIYFKLLVKHSAGFLYPKRWQRPILLSKTHADELSALFCNLCT